MEPKRNYALPIVMMFALFFLIAFVTNLQSPLGVIAKGQFALDTFRSQWGTFANFLAYACMGIPAGALLRRSGYKRTAQAAILVGFAGVGITLLSGRGAGCFPVYLLGAFVSGFSMCMLNTVVNPMLNTLGGGGRRGNQLIQFGGVCNSVGGTLAPVLGGYLMGDAVGSRVIAAADPVFFLAMALFAFTFLVLSLTRIPEPFAVNEPRRTGEVRGALSFRHFRLGVAAIFVYVGVEVGIPSIANFYMTGKGAGALDMDTAVAGTIVGTYWFLMLVGRLAGGLLGGRVASRPMLAATAALGLALVVLGMYLPAEAGVRMPVFRGGASLSFGMETVPAGLMCLVLCGLCTSVMWGAIFNLAVEGLGRYTSMASGLFMTMVAGGGVLPALQGWIADKAGYTTSYWLIFACLLYILYYALAGSRPVARPVSAAN